MYQRESWTTFSVHAYTYVKVELDYICMLPDRSVLIGQKLVENAKIKKFKCDILSGQKLIKNAKNGPFWRVFENLKLAVKQCYQKGQF